jgi:hypothetical protein
MGRSFIYIYITKRLKQASNKEHKDRKKKGKCDSKQDSTTINTNTAHATMETGSQWTKPQDSDCPSQIHRPLRSGKDLVKDIY